MSNSTSDSLFELINSLSKSEKRFFNLYASRHIIGEENNAILLFDFISKMKLYDEAKLFEHFKGRSFLNKFSITKYRLYQQILDSLNLFHSKASVEFEISNQLQSATVLFEKGLYSHSKKILESAVKKADKNNLQALMLQGIQQLKRLHEKHFYTDLNAKSSEDLKELEYTVLENLTTQSNLWHVKTNLFKELHSIGTVRSDEQVKCLYMHIEGLRDVNESSLNDDNAYLYHQIMAAFYFATYNLKACFNSLQYLHELLSTNLTLKSGNKDKYLSVLTNLTYVCIKTNRLKKASIYLKELAQIEKDFTKTNDLQVKYFSSFYSLKLFICIERGEADLEEVILNKIRDGIRSYNDLLNPIRKAYLQFQLGVYYLGRNQYKESLAFLNEVLNEKQNLQKEDIYSFAQILQLIIHFELKNHKYLPYALTSTKRYLKGKNRLYQFEKVFLNIIGKIKHKSPATIDLEDVLIEFEPEINALREDKYEKLAFEYFDFGAWLKSKIYRKTYLETKKASA